MDSQQSMDCGVCLESLVDGCKIVLEFVVMNCCTFKICLQCIKRLEGSYSVKCPGCRDWHERRHVESEYLDVGQLVCDRPGNVLVGVLSFPDHVCVCARVSKKKKAVYEGMVFELLFFFS